MLNTVNLKKSTFSISLAYKSIQHAAHFIISMPSLTILKKDHESESLGIGKIMIRIANPNPFLSLKKDSPIKFFESRTILVKDTREKIEWKG